MQAQKDTTLVRTVVVENQYAPNLLPATKLNLYPGVEEDTPSTHSFQYARSLRPVTGWGRDVMPLLGDTFADAPAHRGYVRLGYGTHGQAEAAAGYLWDITDDDRLQADLSLDGWDGKHPTLRGQNWTSRLYQSRLGLDYRHRFRQYALTLGGEWQNTVFNYLPWDEVYHHQRFTQYDIHAGLSSTDRELPLQFTLQTGFRTFSTHQPREKQVHTVGDVWAPISQTQRVGVAFTMDNTFYSVKEGQNLFDNTTAVGLNPYYAYDDEDWRLRLGVHVDPLLGGDDKGVDVAPDIRLERVMGGNSVIYLQAVGGRELNDFRRLASVSPYAVIPSSVRATYVPLNATFGFKMSPLAGWWFHVYGGYQIRQHELFAQISDAAAYEYVAFRQAKGKVGFGGAELKYTYKDVLDVAAQCTLYSWSVDEAEDEAVLLAYKPRYEGHIHADWHLFPELKIQAGFEYTDRRAAGDASVQNLYTGAAYELEHSFTVFARVNNLLNKEYRGVNLYPADKLGFRAGIQWRF
jgi:hypothetical protein